MIEGLREASRLARHQAAICRSAYNGQADADVLESYAKTLDALIVQAEWRFENEPTDPMIVSVRCRCGFDVPVKR